MADQPRVKPVKNVLAVVLAAGGGSRFTGAGHKLLAERGGRTVVEHAVAAAHEALGEVLVVTGAVRLPDAVTAAPGVRLIHNPDWADGQATSLATAITLAAADDTIDAVVVGLGDQPDITSDALAPSRVGRGTDRDRDLRRPAPQSGAAPSFGLAVAPDHRRRGCSGTDSFEARPGGGSTLQRVA